MVGGAVILFLPPAPSLLLLAILWAVEVLASTASVPAEEALVADPGESFGLYTFAIGSGAVIGPLIGGWLYDQAGHTVPFCFTALLAFVGICYLAGIGYMFGMFFLVLRKQGHCGLLPRVQKSVIL